MLKRILSKLGLRKHADEESYGADTTSMESRREDARDARSTRSPADDSTVEKPTGDEPPGHSG